MCFMLYNSLDEYVSENSTIHDEIPMKNDVIKDITSIQLEMLRVKWLDQ